MRIVNFLNLQVALQLFQKTFLWSNLLIDDQFRQKIIFSNLYILYNKFQQNKINFLVVLPEIKIFDFFFWESSTIIFKKIQFFWSNLLIYDQFLQK